MFIIGIAGGTGSGKTTVVRKIMERLPKGEVGIISQDSYYKDSSHVPVEDRQKINFDEPAAFDWNLLLEHLKMLKQGKAEQLLRELSLSTRTEKSLKEFYRTFDSTFLQAICPDFVDRFNELLREDARFSPKPGSLNTELRIFALIRLGVDDSREIAELLHYSASTIYNYKVSVKNAALGDRDRFEEAVKKIGK